MPDNTVRSFDLELMDCVVCCKPLSPPIIQCQNGHATCNSCSVKMGKYHACTLPVGPMRCLIMEAVVESLTVYCQNKIYGCQESFRSDEKYCSFIECSCPLPECNVKGSSEMIYDHCKELHTNILTPFYFGRKFPVSVDMNDRGLLVLTFD
ncbi:E3 ubiquitin-protein ligase SINA-like 10 [Mercurialis annua]|uniref:E3 ubiquitin-protein ligase SINA-like 10 n=1 Tax=Mercurialis annua TaxID=3986 RepID=UPI00215DFDB6|nr:E3 ubiquitin-protein ligase SINA-like 10 [Mercurialis annua]